MATYYCINCGFESPQIYKTYAQGNLIKLLECKRCKELVDKYVEYDIIIVVMNLVLQNKIAFRHLLLNEKFEGFWKLGVLFLFCEAYCFWCFQKGMESEAHIADFYELEINFYRVLLRTFVSTAAFHFLMMTCCKIRFSILGEIPPSQFSYLTLWKGLCLSGFAEVFELIALIWAYSHNQSRIFFVTGLFLLSNIRSYQAPTSNNLDNQMEGEIPVLLKPIAWIIGTWECKNASGRFPTIQDFNYNEVLEFRLCGQQPLLAYSSWSSHPVKNNPMHLESGFLRATGDGKLSFMVAHNFGLTSIEEGLVQDKEIGLRTTHIGRMTPSKETVQVLEFERKFTLTGENKLRQMSWMSTSKTPTLTEHLRADYVKKA